MSIRVRFLFAFVSSSLRGRLNPRESAQSAIPLPFGHLSIRVSILFRISCLGFRVSAHASPAKQPRRRRISIPQGSSPVSKISAVNEKHGLCRNIQTRNAADPQKSTIKHQKKRFQTASRSGHLMAACTQSAVCDEARFTSKLPMEYTKMSETLSLNPCQSAKSVKSVVKINLTSNLRYSIILIKLT